MRAAARINTKGHTYKVVLTSSDIDIWLRPTQLNHTLFCHEAAVKKIKNKKFDL